MASPQAGVWGIDLGQCALKAIRLQKVNDEIVATAFDYIEHPKILSQPDADPDQLTREALEQFLSRNSIKGDTVVISVPGQSGLARFVKLPPVEEKKIADIVKFEAKQQIPFPLEEVVWDFQKIGSGMVTDGFAMETEIGLFAMKRDMVNRALQQFKEVDVDVHVVQMTPLALCNFVAYDLLNLTGSQAAGEDGGEKKSCVVALDIGTDNSNLVITDGNKVIWQRPIPLGGNHFTRALTKDMKLTFAKAEHLKRNAVKSPDLKKILASLKAVLNDFVGEAQRSLGYFTNTHRDASIQYMVGLGNAFRLPGLQKYLQEKLGLEVRKLGQLERVKGEEVVAAPTFQENLLSFAVAYGLALQGLNLTRIQTNLLPHEIRLERVIRGKKPFALAAAAVLLLAIAGLTFGQAEAFKAVKNKDIDVAKKKVGAVKTSAEKYKSDTANEESRHDANVKAQINISAGVMERTNWQDLFQYINMALPRPNGEKLSKKTAFNRDADDLYRTDLAKAALDALEEKRFVKTTGPADPAKTAKMDKLIKQWLIQINVEGITPLYSEDLPGFLKKVYEQKPNLEGMAKRERDAVVQMADPERATKENVDTGNLPKLPDKGWVVEIRGYTYHNGGRDFVVDTLQENLAFPEKIGNELNPILPEFPPSEQIRGNLVKLEEPKVSMQVFKKKFEDPTSFDLANEVKVSLWTKNGLEKVEEGLKSSLFQPSENRKTVPATLIIKNQKVVEIVLAEKKTKGEFLVMYENKKVDNPEPGIFQFIRNGHLPKLVGGGPGGGAPGGLPGGVFPGQDGGKGPGPKAPPGAPQGKDGGPPDQGKDNNAGPKEADRSGWRSLGEIASAVLGGGNNTANLKGGGAADAQPRIEFVIFFIWRENLTSQ